MVGIDSGKRRPAELYAASVSTNPSNIRSACSTELGLAFSNSRIPAPNASAPRERRVSAGSRLARIRPSSWSRTTVPTVESRHSSIRYWLAEPTSQRGSGRVRSSSQPRHSRRRSGSRDRATPTTARVWPRCTSPSAEGRWINPVSSTAPRRSSRDPANCDTTARACPSVRRTA